MTRGFLNFFILAGLLVVQTSLFSILPIVKYLNPILLFVVYLSIKKSGRTAFLAIIGGYFLDIYSSYPFGTHTLALVLVNFTAGYIYFNILTNHRFLPIIFLLLAEIILYHTVLLAAASALAFLNLMPKIKFLTSAAFKNIGAEIFYTILLGTCFYVIFYFAGKRFIYEKKRLIP